MQANQNEIKGILYFLIKKLDKLSQQIKIEDDFEEILKSSKIVDNKQIKIIKNWISSEKKITCKLLYDGKRDGIKGSNYHSNCDGKGPNITFIKTNQGRRF